MGKDSTPKCALCLTLSAAEKNVMPFLIRKWPNLEMAHIKADTTNFLVSIGSKLLVNIYKQTPKAAHFRTFCLPMLDMTQIKNRLWFLSHLSTYSIKFSINSLHGLDGCKRIALDDNLAIALVFNTNKGMYINFEITFVLYSENHEQ